MVPSVRILQIFKHVAHSLYIWDIVFGILNMENYVAPHKKTLKRQKDVILNRNRFNPVHAEHIDIKRDVSYESFYQK